MEFAKLKPDKIIQNYAWNHQAHIADGPHFQLFIGENATDHTQLVIKQINRCNISDPEVFSNFIKDIKVIEKKKLVGCVKYIDLVKSNDCFYFIQSFCNGGDLRKHLHTKGKLDESEAVTIIQTIIKAFQSFAKENLIHGNLKPENIQFHNKTNLINDYLFTNYHAIFIPEKGAENNEEFFYYSPQQLGSATYKLTPKCDIWTLGLMYYEMIYGTLPWTGKTKAEYLQIMRKIPIRFPFNLPISEKSQDFIKGCLQIEENGRFSWEQIFKHPIFSSGASNSKAIDPTNKKTTNFSQKSMKLIRELQAIISKQNLDIEKLFNSFDKTGDKALDLHEFMKLIVVMQPKLEMADIQEIFQRFDENHDGNISLVEFKKLILETDYRENSENEQLADFRGQKILDHIINIILENNLDLEKMISQFDVTGDKMLKFGEFLPIIRAFDKSITDQDGKFIFKIFDKNSDGELTYPELKTILEIELQKKEKNAENAKPIKKKPEVGTIANKMLEDLKKVIVYNKLDTKKVFSGFDKSGDSMLDFDEFKGLVAIINARFSEKDIRELFNLFDLNKDGNVSLDEFQKALLG